MTMFRCVPLQWYEVRDIAIAIVHAFWAIRGEPCPDCVPACSDCARRGGLSK
jgi:hypothetical protein